MLALRILTPQEGYQSIHWQVIVLIASLIPVGLVIQTTGTAEWIGTFISNVAKSFPEFNFSKTSLNTNLFSLVKIFTFSIN